MVTANRFGPLNLDPNSARRIPDQRESEARGELRALPAESLLWGENIISTLNCKP